jgi:peptide/nickel transport system ATP-binding protein
MSELSKSFLSVRNLIVEYTQGKNVIHAVNNISFDVEKGKTLGVVGETGAGKTTIAKAILRILPDRACSIKNGQIFLDGEEISSYSEEEMLKVRGNKIAMIFQDPMTALNPLMTIGEQIIEVIHLHNPKMSKQDAIKQAVEMLEMVGIAGKRFIEFPHQFSGGMKQRVVIAMALACDPELLLADEPTTALDVTIQAQVLELIKNLQKKFNTSMILITHDLGVVAETCDNVVVIYAGRIVEYATKKDLFMHPLHPYTVGLFGSLPSMNSISDRLLPIPGMPPNPARLPEGCSFAPRCSRMKDECMRKEVPLFEVEPGHFCSCHCAAKEVAK